MYTRYVLIALFSLVYGNGHAQNTSNKAFIDSVGSYICQCGIKHPEIVMKQAIWETGWFKSKHLMRKNNLFGFRGKSYLTFKSWRESVEYYKKWQDKRYDQTKYKDYYEFLTKIRYGHSGYSKTLRTFQYEFSCP